MVELFQQDIRTNDRQSSKGNQLKWKKGPVWYKADYLGYEGLAEYLISNLLKKSDLPENLLVVYQPEEISYNEKVFSGCSSRDFLAEGEQLITLERLFKNATGESLYSSVFRIEDHKSRMKYLVSQVERYTGLKNFGEYFARLLTVDGMFLNEDRHYHNIAVIMTRQESFRLCPVFDMGAGLLSDTMYDYPEDSDIYNMIERVRAKSICDSFDEQMEIAEHLYGRTLKFSFNRQDVKELIDRDTVYPERIKTRVMNVLYEQMRKYSYLFCR